jgi:tetratricopeptide (TPR) repeat protein
MVGLLSAWRDWSERRQILREIRHQQADQRERDYFTVKDQLTHAHTALERSDLTHATDIWASLMEHQPALARQSPLALRVLVGLRRFDEAEALMRTGQKAHPADFNFVKGLAEIALAKHDYDSVIEHCAFLRKRFPGVAEGYTYGASAFLQKGQPQQAEALSLEAIKRFPDNIGGPLEYARTAVTAKNWEQALERWQPVLDQFGYFGAYVGSAQALTHLGRYEEAEELLQQARIRFGTNPGPLSEYARVAEAKGDIPVAIQRWKDVLDRFPLDMNVHFTASEAFERLGEPAEAEATLRAAVDRYPTELRPHTELARLIHLKHHEFAAAVEAWAAIRQIFPDNDEAYLRGAEALRGIGRADEADSMLKAYKSGSEQTT